MCSRFNDEHRGYRNALKREHILILNDKQTKMFKIMGSLHIFYYY